MIREETASVTGRNHQEGHGGGPLAWFLHVFPGHARSLNPHMRFEWRRPLADLALAIVCNPYLTNQVPSLDGGIYPR